MINLLTLKKRRDLLLSMSQRMKKKIKSLEKSSKIERIIMNFRLNRMRIPELLILSFIIFKLTFIIKISLQII